MGVLVRLGMPGYFVAGWDSKGNSPETRRTSRQVLGLDGLLIETPTLSKFIF